MRVVKKHSVRLTKEFKKRILTWAQHHDEVIWLDTNQHHQKHTQYQAILATDAFTAIKTDSFNAFEKLEEYQTKTKDWLFGYVTYDVKNDVENLSSANFDGLFFPDLYFFQPKKLFLFSENEVEIQYLNFVADEIENDWNEINLLNSKEAEDNTSNQKSSESVKIQLRTSKDSYFEKLNKLLQHIHVGDIYEANFCQEFYSENVKIAPVKTYLHLNDISRPPFATYLKLDKYYSFSASPERYIKKTGTKVISQPIKGTSKRLLDKIEDEKLKLELQKDTKERSENIMITDLVRNDLSKIANKGSVQVEELCKVYSFAQVHQMISTVSCEVSEHISAVSILKHTFPMGSMTGAPKISAMKIIEELEDAKRGLYSGTVGYFTPSGDFDFNVMIRSILYNSENNYVSFSVGGAITEKSIPENEYEECLLKAKAMREVLEGSF